MMPWGHIWGQPSGQLGSARLDTFGLLAGPGLGLLSESGVRCSVSASSGVRCSVSVRSPSQLLRLSFFDCLKMVPTIFGLSDDIRAKRRYSDNPSTEAAPGGSGPGVRARRRRDGWRAPGSNTREHTHTSAAGGGGAGAGGEGGGGHGGAQRRGAAGVRRAPAGTAGGAHGVGGRHCVTRRGAAAAAGVPCRPRPSRPGVG